MSILEALSDDLRSERDEATAEFEVTLDELSREDLLQVRRYLSRAVVEFEATGDDSELKKFARSLMLTAELRRDRGYVEWINSEPETEPEGESVADLLTRVYEQRRTTST